jgi:hypothetical protein
MPARTNPFQQLIATIQRQLKGHDCKVTESAMVALKPGHEPTELDVLIEGPLAGNPVRVSLECRSSRSRKGDRPWVEQLAGKYGDSGIRAIAVHNIGFTKGARQKAADKGIECISTSEAADKDWYATLRRGHVEIMRATEYTAGNPRFYNSDGAVIRLDQFPCEISLPSGILVTVDAYVDSLLNAAIQAYVDTVMADEQKAREIREKALNGDGNVPLPAISIPTPGVQVLRVGTAWYAKLGRVELDLAVKFTTEFATHDLYAWREHAIMTVNTTRPNGQPTKVLIIWDAKLSTASMAQMNPPEPAPERKPRRKRRTKNKTS